MKEMDSGDCFPTWRPQKLSSSLSSSLAVSITSLVLYDCQTTSPQKPRRPFATDIPTFNSSSGWPNLAYVTNLISPETKQVTYKSYLQEQPCFLLQAPSTQETFTLAANFEVDNFYRFSEICLRHSLIAIFLFPSDKKGRFVSLGKVNGKSFSCGHLFFF